MAYRKEVFKGLEFDEDFPELYKDDEDFSYRVSQKYRNLYTPYAKLAHRLSSVAGGYRSDRTYVRMKKTMPSRYYLFMKNFPRTTRNTLAFWWSVVGSLLQATITMKKDNIRGAFDGISGIRDFSKKWAGCIT